MARSTSGKSVARAAATGGGTTYRGQMPVNWYAALVVIVILGLASIVFAKYEYNQSPTAVQPTVGTTWHAALAFDICGTMQPALAASPSSATTGLTTSGDGVLLVAPKTSSEAGNNATLGKFAQGYTGLTLTNTTLKYPSAKVPEYTNGQRCATGTPDAGKPGEVQARWWVLSTKTGSNGQLEQTGGITSLAPADLKLLNRQLITVGFVPDNATLPKPPASTITALLQVLSGGSTPVTTTTVAGQTTTTVHMVGTTTTTQATTTTRAPATTTTQPASTTSTSSKK